MINHVAIIGRLTKDIELRKTQSNKSVVQFTLACNRNFKTDGQPDADFINCVAWGKTAENMERYLKKGSLVGIEGRIQTRKYDGNNGKVYITEILVNNVQFLEAKSGSQTNESVAGYNSAQGEINAQGNDFDYSSANLESSIEIDPNEFPFY